MVPQPEITDGSQREPGRVYTSHFFLASNESLRSLLYIVVDAGMLPALEALPRLSVLDWNSCIRGSFARGEMRRIVVVLGGTPSGRVAVRGGSGRIAKCS